MAGGNELCMLIKVGFKNVYGATDFLGLRVNLCGKSHLIFIG